MSRQSSTRGVGALNTQSYGLSRYQSRKMRQPLDYYTSDSSSNGDEQWERTRAMACTALTVTPASRRMIRSTVTRPAMSLASQRIARALARRRMLFSLSLETQIPLESMNFSRLGNPITHLVIYGGFSIPGPAFTLLPNYRP